MSILTYFSSIFYFYTPWKQKNLWFSVVFRGYGKGTFAWWESWEGIPDKTRKTPTWQLSLITLGLYLDFPLDSANWIWFWNIATEIKLFSKKLLRSSSMTKFPSTCLPKPTKLAHKIHSQWVGLSLGRTD